MAQILICRCPQLWGQLAFPSTAGLREPPRTQVVAGQIELVWHSEGPCHLGNMCSTHTTRSWPRSNQRLNDSWLKSVFNRSLRGIRCNRTHCVARVGRTHTRTPPPRQDGKSGNAALTPDTGGRGRDTRGGRERHVRVGLRSEAKDAAPVPEHPGGPASAAGGG